VHSLEKNVFCGSCNEGFQTFADLMSHQRSNSLCHGIVQRVDSSQECQPSTSLDMVTSEHETNIQRPHGENNDIISPSSSHTVTLKYDVNVPIPGVDSMQVITRDDTAEENLDAHMMETSQNSQHA